MIPNKLLRGLLVPTLVFLGWLHGYTTGHTNRGQEREFREVEAQLIAKRINPSDFDEKKNKEIAKNAFYCREQINLDMEKIARETEVIDIIDNIITAKEFLEKLKDLGIPTERYEQDLKSVEVALMTVKKKK